MSQTLPAALFDPFAPGFTDDPYPQYAALRDTAPVYQHPLGFWLLSCYDDVSWLLRANLSVEDRNIAAIPLLELREQMYGEGAARPRRVAMLYRDPPDHTRLRRLVSKAFTPRAVQALRPRVTGLVDSLLDAAQREGRVDPNCGSTGRTRASMSRSAPGRTTAWARHWPGWRPRSPSRG
jgi:cytochrome P450